MEKRSTLYILFREYVDQGTPPSHLYIRGEEFPLGEKEVLNAEIKIVFDIIDFFRYERRTVLYDRDNLNHLLILAKAFPKEYPGVSSSVTAQLKRQGATVCRSLSANKRRHKYFLFNMNVTNDMLGDMARRQTSGKIPCVLVHHNAIDTANGDIILNSNNTQTVILHTCSDLNSLHKWFSENRKPERQYHYSKKHGDADHPARFFTDRHGNRRQAAQLLTNREQTEQLLKYAVGKSVHSELWYYDEDNACFIYFENEGNNPQLGFHAYHLHSGEENYENIDIEKLRQVQDCIPDNI